MDRGRLIRSARKARGDTQYALAEAMGVSQGAVKKWENGGGIEMSRLKQLSEYLEVPLDQLLGGDPTEASIQAMEYEPLLDVVAVLDQDGVYDQLLPSTKARVIHMLYTLCIEMRADLDDGANPREALKQSIPAIIAAARSVKD